MFRSTLVKLNIRSANKIHGVGIPQLSKTVPKAVSTTAETNNDNKKLDQSSKDVTKTPPSDSVPNNDHVNDIEKHQVDGSKLHRNGLHNETHGWSEIKASHSEAIVKAERHNLDEHDMEALQKRTVDLFEKNFLEASPESTKSSKSYELPKTEIADKKKSK